MPSHYRSDAEARRIERAIELQEKKRKERNKKKPTPSMLGSGAAKKAAKELSGRNKKLDKILDNI